MKCRECPFTLACAAGTTGAPHAIARCHYCPRISLRVVTTTQYYATQKTKLMNLIFVSLNCIPSRIQVPRMVACCPFCDETTTLFGYRNVRGNEDLFWDLEDPKRYAAFRVWLKEKREE